MGFRLKQLLTVPLIIMCFYYSANAQQNEKILKLKEYLNTLNMYANRDTIRNFRNMEDKAFKKLVKDIYEGIEVAPDELGLVFEDDKNKKMKLEKDNPGLDTLFLNSTQYLILDIIKQRCSNFTYIITRVPIFVKATVVSMREEVYPGKEEIRGQKRNYHFHYLKLKTESLLKGKANFLNNSEYEVWYMNWVNVPREKDFKIGKTYLIPVWYRTSEKNQSEYSVATWVDEHGSRFLVENDIMDDEYEAFGMGTRVKWSDFVDKFNDSVSRIKNIVEN